MTPINKIKQILQKFQEGYIKRDVAVLDEFMEELFGQTDEIFIIGTGATKPGGHEWCVGREKVRGIFESDWKGWGDLRIDIDNAVINLFGDTACIGMFGTISATLPPDGEADYFWNEYLQRIQAKEMNGQLKMMKLVKEANEILYQNQFGEKHCWIIRISAVMIKENGKWHFKQIHFSHPTTSYPDGRIVDDEALN